VIVKRGNREAANDLVLCVEEAEGYMYGFRRSRDRTESATVTLRAGYYKMCCHTVGCRMRFEAQPR
jgi:hypothetical protein